MYFRMFLVVSLLICSSFALKTLRLQKREHKVCKEVDSSPFLNKYSSSSSGKRVGNSIPLKGGYVNLGTYYLTLTVGNPPKNFNLLVKPKIRKKSLFGSLN